VKVRAGPGGGLDGGIGRFSHLWDGGDPDIGLWRVQWTAAAGSLYPGSSRLAHRVLAARGGFEIRAFETAEAYAASLRQVLGEAAVLVRPATPVDWAHWRPDLLFIDPPGLRSGRDPLYPTLRCLLTGRPFRLTRIRANRDRPGLRPQHPAAIRAAARVSVARVVGDRVGSAEIELVPDPVRAGDYFFDIGTAGATSLVLQTLLLPLALAPGGSAVTIRGRHPRALEPLFSLSGSEVRGTSRLVVSRREKGSEPPGSGQARALGAEEVTLST
jgi:hypothetical protein